jgi:ferredoxin-NADP reductase
MAVGKALVDTHCNRCHGLDRVYGALKDPEAWRDTVARMVVYARGTQGFFKPGDDERIIRFLSSTQSPQAGEIRAAQVRAPAAESSGVESPNPARGSQRSSSSAGSVLWTTVGVVTALSAMFGTLLMRRPKMSIADTASIPREAVAKFEPQKSLVLQLVSIERQARNCVTLRFRVPEKHRFNAKPGQFLTFSFLIDGEKFIRSYSICSSPTQVGYVEITAKRKPNGCISVFLNDDAAIGLTVEARGPFGQFYFDESQNQKIVLIAAGSGITPMLSILRYIDDRCLPTEVFLVYSVRTRLDVLFHQELERLQGRLRNFRYLVTLTQPDAEWSGLHGRLNRDLLERNIVDLATPAYFLCGPEAFMENAKEILAGIGVAATRIKYERFGGKSSVLSTSPDLTSTPATVQFMRSNRTGHIPPGSTLLEAAERCEVPIPSSCRQGQCGTCAVKLLQGQVRMDVEDGLDPEQKSQGYVLTCVGRAIGDVTLDA